MYIEINQRKQPILFRLTCRCGCGGGGGCGRGCRGGHNLRRQHFIDNEARALSPAMNAIPFASVARVLGVQRVGCNDLAILLPAHT